MKKFPLAVLSLLAAAGAAHGQDSVPTSPGGNDALSAYDTTLQRVRYVVDGVAAATSWNNSILVAPVLKATRDSDPSFKTQILGSASISPSLALNTAFASENYALWTTAGQGINPGFNAAAASSIPVAGFASQFAIASSDFSLAPTSAVGAIVGRDATTLSRFYVERTVAAVSRSGSFNPDTSCLSFGSADALGNLYLRADNFNTLPATTNRVVGDSILRINLDARSASSLNTLTSSASVNSAADAAATTFIVSNEATPTNVPAGVLQPGVGPFGLVFDFTSRFRAGSSTAGLSTLSHLGAGAAGHRGNPGFAAISPLGGTAGTGASLALPSASTRINGINAFGLNFGSAGGAPSIAPGTARLFTLPTSISAPDGFVTNTSGTASFKQYLSQISFRGGNGLVGIGQNASGQLVLAATANDPAHGDFIAVVTATGPSTSTWTIAARQGQPVLDGPAGAQIGTLATPTTALSAPAVDRLGNIYFVGTWKPTLTPAVAGLFRAVTTAGGYKLELLLTVGQTITGANSTRPYTISSLTLTDGDSLASGAFHGQQLLSEQTPGNTTTNAADIQSFGALIVNSVLTYDNNSINESYDTVLLVTPGAGTPACPADFNGVGGLTVQDIFDFLGAYFSNLPSADFNGVGGVTVQDIFDFLGAYFAGCP